MKKVVAMERRQLSWLRLPLEFNEVAAWLLLHCFLEKISQYKVNTRLGYSPGLPCLLALHIAAFVILSPLSSLRESSRELRMA